MAWPGAMVSCEFFQIDGVLRSTQRKFCSRTNPKTPSAVYHHPISSVSCFRAATVELVSYYNQQEQRGGRRTWQRSGVVRAGQDEAAEQRWVKEEQRWVREEQRWLREEQRWGREEARWRETSQALQDEVRALRAELEELRGGQRGGGGEITDISLRNLVGGMRSLLQALALPGSEDLPVVVDSPKQIPGSVPLSGGEEATAFVVEGLGSVVSPVSFVATSDEVIASVTPSSSLGLAPEETAAAAAPPSSSQSSNGSTNKSLRSTVLLRKTLKSGMEGDDVKQLHDALSELGFYAGEEDIEFSMFSSGTQRAVKTLQATRGVPEDGKVTEELMEALLSEIAAQKPATTDGAKASSSQPAAKAESALKVKQPAPETRPPGPYDGGRAREIDRFERSNAQETGIGSSRRVYLLGENRWEEPGRVQKKQEEERRIKNEPTSRMKVGLTVCFACRGVGTMLCTDCEGTGDLNVEEQFLEWLEEDEAKCPYCEGSGALTCDVCDGQPVTAKT